MSNPSTFLREKQEDGGTREEQEKKKTCMRRAMLFHATTPLDLSVGWTVSLRGTLLQQRKTNYWRDKRDRKVQN